MGNVFGFRSRIALFGNVSVRENWSAVEGMSGQVSKSIFKFKLQDWRWTFGGEREDRYWKFIMRGNASVHECLDSPHWIEPTTWA